MPSMDKTADKKFKEGSINYTLAWGFLTFLGIFGIHRFYMQKWLSAILYLLSAGVFGLGVLYDFWTLNSQISEVNKEN